MTGSRYPINRTAPCSAKPAPKGSFGLSMELLGTKRPGILCEPRTQGVYISIKFLTFTPDESARVETPPQGFRRKSMHRALSSYVAIRRQVGWLRRIPRLVSVALVLVLSLSCDESLPPYDVPSNLFRGTIRPTFIQLGSHLWIILTVQNTFDETLQDVANLKGSLEIVLARDPSIHKTVTLDSRNLLYHFNERLGYPLYANVPAIDQRGILTINSKDSVRFFYDWTFMSDDSLYLPTQVFRMHEDTRYPGNFIAEPETFILKGYVQVFTRTGLVIFEPVQYVLNFYLPA